MKWKYELTDTFGDQPNYSWVRRGVIAGDKPTALRAVRREYGLTDRALITRAGDVIELRWRKQNLVLFFEPAEDLVQYKVSHLYAPREAVIWADSHYDALVRAARLFATDISKVDAAIYGGK